MSKKPHGRKQDSLGRPGKSGSKGAARPAPPAALRADASTREQGWSLGTLSRRAAQDMAGFGIGRSMAIGRLVLVEAMRMRVWGVILIGLAAIIVSDLTTRHFDPVTDTLPSLVRTSEITLAVLGIVVALFLSTYSLPHEMATRTIYSLVTKPVSRLEIVCGKFLGLAMVLGLLTLGLGAATWGYMQLRTVQVQQMARERLQERQGQAWALASDIEPVTLDSIANRGPLAARVFLEASERLQIVPDLITGDRLWLSGFPNHMAHWGFDRLPRRDIDAGQGRIIIRVSYDDPASAEALERREVLVRIVDENGSSWSGSRVLSISGELELEIPGVSRQTQAHLPFSYTGGKLWVSLAGVNNPRLGVDDSSVEVVVGERRFASASGLRTTTSQTMGKFWLSSGERYSGLHSRTRFRGIPASLSASGTQLQIDVTVPSAVDVRPESRAFVALVNPSRVDDVREYTFRPERRTSLLLNVPAEMLDGGSLDVFVGTREKNVELGVNEASVRLISHWRAFGWNWLKNLLMAWLSFCAVSSIGLMFSTVSGWYVASLATSVMVVVAHVWQTILYNVQRYGLGVGGGHHHHGDPGAGPSAAMVWLERVHEWAFMAMGRLLPNFGQMDFGDRVALGVDAPVDWLLSPSYGVFWQVLVYVAAMLLLAYLLFVRKEVAK
jgi:hypothetical protein